MLLGLCGLAACTTSVVTSSEYDDLAAIVGSGVATPERAGDLGVVQDSLMLARGSLPKGFVIDKTGMVFGTRGDIFYRYRVDCLQPWQLAACDPPAQSAVVRASWSGDLAMAAFEGAIERSAVLRLDYLATPMASVTGTTELAAQRATFDTGRTYRVSSASELMLFADMPSQAMMGGAAETALEVDVSGDRYTVAAELQVTGGPVATLVLDDEHTYLLDLATGAVTRTGD